MSHYLARTLTYSMFDRLGRAIVTGQYDRAPFPTEARLSNKVGEVIIDVGRIGAIDERYAHKTGLVSWRGDLYHFYTAASGKGMGENGDIRGITVARSQPWK